MKLKSILFCASAIALSFSSYGQSIVSTGSTKYTLLEEGTGTWCGYCPDGAQRLQQTVEPNYPHCISVSFHNGDAMALSGDPFNSTYISSFPGGAVDRLVWTHGSTTSVNVNRGYWATDVGVQDATSPTFQIDMASTYDSTTRMLKTKITATALAALTGNYRINAYLVEDSISSAASGYVQHSYMYSNTTSWFYNQCQSACPGYPCSSCANLPDSIYAHMNVVRKVFATGGSIFGDAALANPAVGDTASKSYSYTLPSTYNAKFCKLVALVQKYGSTTSDRPIQNAARADLRTMDSTLTPTGVASINYGMKSVQLYPNPASNYVHVTGTLGTPSETGVTVTNAIGQVLFEQVYPNTGSTMFSENIPVNNFANGVYVMTITNDNIVVSKRFTVNR